MTESTKSGPVFNPEMLTLRRDSRGMTQAALAATVGISQAKLSLIESGAHSPSDEELERLAAALGRPKRFFHFSDRIYGPGVSEFYHRKRRSVGAKALNQAHATINEDIMVVRRLLRSAEVDTSGIDSVSSLPEIIDKAAVEEIARAVRAAWKLPSGPIANVVQVLERAGCLVIEKDFPAREIDAVSWWIPGLPPIMFVSNSIPGDRMRHTLCHELGHLILHNIPNSEMEKEADGFAGAFLLPKREIRPYLQEVSLPVLANLKPVWKVAMQALLIRAQQLNTISENQARYLWMQIGRSGFRRQEPRELEIPRERPTLFHELVRVHREELGLNATNIASLLAMLPDEVASRYGIVEEKRLRLVRN